MPNLISENFIRNEIPRLMKDRDERFFRDSKLTNFSLRVRRGAKGLTHTFFVVADATSGRKIKLGDYPAFSAVEAREEASRMLRALEKGDDPKSERQAKKALPLFQDLVAAFDAKFLPKKKPSTRKRYNGVIDRVLMPALKDKRVADITTAMISAMYAKKADRQADANNAMRVLSKMMTFAIGEGMRSTNPCKGIERYRNRERERWLDERELPSFVAALAAAPGDPVHDLIRFLAVTGWRVSDARLLDWSQVSLKTLSVRLEDSVTKGRPQVLSPDAAVLVDRQKGRVGAVFSNRATMPVSYKLLRETLAAVLKAAGIAEVKPASDGVIERVTPHTLRHNAASWCALAGADPFMLRDTFAWKSLAMANRYVKVADFRARAGAGLVASAINIITKPAADVVNLKR